MSHPVDREDGVADFSLVLASSVHDMKNSLGMLLNSLEETIIEMPAKTPAQQQRFATLQYEASRINGELIQLLSLYRMDQESMPVHIEENYVRDMLDEQMARNEPLFISRRINVDCQCSEELVWYYDTELVGGVIHNVLVNCARYTRSQLRVEVYIDEGLHIKISDNGGGYPNAMLAQPINREGRISFSSGSTNLGLYFAQTVAKLHKVKGVAGYIVLENGGDLGGGVFHLFLP